MRTGTSSTERGFSLIEMLVIIAIIVTLTSTLMFGLRSTRSSAGLNQAAMQVVTSIREAREYAIAIRPITDASGQQYPSWGVYLQKNSSNIVLYADCKDDDNGDATLTISDLYAYDPSNPTGNCSSGDRVRVETRTLPSGVIISEIRGTKFDGTQVTPNAASLLYMAPIPVSWFNMNNQWDSDIATVEILLQNPVGTTVTVTTNLNGLVYVSS